MKTPTDVSHLACPQRPLRTLLVGTSLEPESDQVVRTSLALARSSGARVALVHAAEIEPPIVGFESGFDQEFAREELAAREEELRRQIERLGIGEAELAGSEVRAGSPHRLLVEAAGRLGADLIVVGATGSGPMAAELLGSTADRVLRKAVCPVLVVRGDLHVPPRRVLAPVDLSPLSGDVLRCGLHLLAQLGGGEETEVRAVHALSFLDALQRNHGDVDEVESRCARELRRFVLEYRPDAPVKLETAVRSGEARFEILEELKRHPVDLVVLGTHGRGGLDRLMLGSVASTVARKAPCSVLLISPDAAMAQAIAEAVTARTTPAWHREPATAA